MPLKKIKTLITRHKIASLIIIIIIAALGYFYYKSLPNDVKKTSYALAEVTKGTLITSVSGTGQISVSSQVDVTAKTSGDVTSVLAVNGKKVKSGEILAQLNAQDAYKEVRDAKAALDSAKLSLEKLTQPASDYSIMQAENSLANAKASLEKLKLSQTTDYQDALDAKQKAEDNIVKSYEDAFNAIADTFLDLPTVITQLEDILYSNKISNSESAVSNTQDNSSALINSLNSEEKRSKLTIFKNSALNDYLTARTAYNDNFSDYKNTTRYSDKQATDALLQETIATTKAIAQAAKSESNLLDTWTDYYSQQSQNTFSQVKTYQNNLNTYISQVNSHLSSLLSTQRNLQDYKESLASAENNIKEMGQNNPLDLAASESSVKEKEMSLAELKAGANALDIKSQQLSIQQKENALLDALSQDDKSFTLKLANGGSQIVLFSNSTQVMKSENGSLTDLKIGDNVTANGTTNSDGSLTAQSIQIRPAAATPPAQPAPTSN